jgi:hypothetical protein
MIVSILRSVGAIIASLAVAMILVVAVEGVTLMLHPFPPDAETNDPEVVKAHVARFPGWVLALAAVAWGFTNFVSVWVATRLGAGRHPAHGIGVGLLLLAGVVMNMLMLPYPVWFKGLNLVAFPLGIYWGTKLARASRGESPGQPRDVTQADSPAAG